MRNLILIFFLIINYSYGQEYTNEMGEFHYKEIVETDTTQSVIREIITKWVAVNFNNSNYVTKLNTNDNIIVKGAFDYKGESIDFTMDVAFKDSRYKLEFYGLPKVMNYIGYKLPIIDPEKYNEEQFKQICTKIANELTVLEGKNIILNGVNKEKWVSKHYGRSKEDMESTFSYVKTFFEALATSIKNDTRKIKKDDW